MVFLLPLDLERESYSSQGRGHSRHREQPVVRPGECARRISRREGGLGRVSTGQSSRRQGTGCRAKGALADYLKDTGLIPHQRWSHARLEVQEGLT